VFEVGEIRGFGGYLVELDSGGGGTGAGFSGGQLSFLGGDLVQDFLLVELGENFALVDRLVDVGIEAGDDAAGLGLHLHLGDGPHLAGCDHGAGDVAGFDLGELGGVKLGVAAHGFGRDDAASDEDGEGDAEDDPKALAGFAGGGQTGLQECCRAGDVLRLSRVIGSPRYMWRISGCGNGYPLPPEIYAKSAGDWT